MLAAAREEADTLQEALMVAAAEMDRFHGAARWRFGDAAVAGLLNGAAYLGEGIVPPGPASFAAPPPRAAVAVGLAAGKAAAASPSGLSAGAAAVGGRRAATLAAGRPSQAAAASGGVSSMAEAAAAPVSASGVSLLTPLTDADLTEPAAMRSAIGAVEAAGASSVKPGTLGGVSGGTSSGDSSSGQSVVMLGARAGSGGPQRESFAGRHGVTGGAGEAMGSGSGSGSGSSKPSSTGGSVPTAASGLSRSGGAVAATAASIADSTASTGSSRTGASSRVPRRPAARIVINEDGSSYLVHG
jgi:hypothetical protein